MPRTEKEPRSYADAPNSLQRMVPCSISTPSWSHSTCWWTTGGSSSTLRSRREPAGLAYRPRGHHTGHPRPVVAPLQKRARFLALRSGTSAPLLPEPLFPKPTQPEGALRGARVARLSACSGPNALWRFGGLPCPGHYSHPGHGEGESFSQGAVCRAGHLREERLQDRVGLRVQGSTFGQPRGRDLRLRAGGGSLRRPPHRRLSHHRGLSGDLPGRQGFTGVEWERRWLDLYGALVAATPKDNSKRAWTKTDRRWASGKRQIIEGVIDQLKDIFALERHRAKTLLKVFWPAWRPRWRPTAAGSGSTASSGDRCATWPTFWSERLCITRLRETAPH